MSTILEIGRECLKPEMFWLISQRYERYIEPHGVRNVNYFKTISLDNAGFNKVDVRHAPDLLTLSLNR